MTILFRQSPPLFHQFNPLPSSAPIRHH
ncbi:hypothetical protein L195_g064741, partial [Trifolium pratense]